MGGSFASWYQLWCWDDYSQTGCCLQGLEWLRCGQLKSHLDSRLGAQPGSFFFFFFFWFLHLGCKDCLTAWWLGSEKEPPEREEVARLVLELSEKMHIPIGTELFWASLET